ncbi:MAG: HIT domain-containing protein [Deltaproteobacteria bacterium]|nr:HIT domain-containing protein [Deltaproteobacteria bacterium]
MAKWHMLVIPKKHYVNLFDISEEALIKFVSSIKMIAMKLKELGVDGVNILHASGEAAQQSANHFHFHLVPRFKNDGLDTWPETGYLETKRDEIYKDLIEFFD